MTATPAHEPDYEMAPVLELTTPEHFRALGDLLRLRAIEALGEHAATTKELAAMLGVPTSTMAHHLHVLEEAGLIRVVRTRQVRAITERYYGRTARSLVGLATSADAGKQLGVQLLHAVVNELGGTTPPEGSLSYVFAASHIPPERVAEFTARLNALANEFEDASVTGLPVYRFLAAIYQAEQHKGSPQK